MKSKSLKGNNLIDYHTDKGLHRFELQTYLHFGVRDIILHSIKEKDYQDIGQLSFSVDCTAMRYVH